ncbi:MAG: hypothetical protein HRU75_13075 [Planctomycetia bacterium]|nr:MAG: hypothetical protein HRU75_13075 [Planctomycetia bacterium]
MIDRTVPRFALFAALALLAAAPLPATLASQETWLGEMLVEDLGIPKDELSTEVESLIQGYQQRLASEHISSGEVRDLVRMVLAADTGLDSADPIDMAKRMRTIRENGGATMLEFMTRVQPLVKMSPDRYERFAAVRQTFDVAAPLYHDPIARTQRVLDNLPEVLDLNEEQRAQFDQMLASLKESGVEKYSAANLYQELLASEDAGTSETSAMLRQRIDSLLEGYEGHVAALFERLDPILAPDQRAILQNTREHALAVAPRRLSDAPADARSILRQARRLKLDSAQRRKLDELTRATAPAWRDAGRDEQAHRLLADSVMAELRKFLKADQVRELESRITPAPARPKADRPSQPAAQPPTAPKPAPAEKAGEKSGG